MPQEERWGGLTKCRGAETVIRSKFNNLKKWTWSLPEDNGMTSVVLMHYLQEWDWYQEVLKQDKLSSF